MVKTATAILVITLVFSGVYGLLITFKTQMIAESTLEARTGKTFADVADKGVADTIMALARHMGVFSLCIVIAVFFVLFKGFKKGEKWAWWAILFAGGIAYIYGLIIQSMEKDMLNMILHIVGTVLLFIGLLLPVKEFFGKKAQA
ncbi:MAG: hypothetical protein AB1715_01635 [Acidobacteriota bacterium]